MPRGNRYILSGRLYHVTHRCHDRQFLLKFTKDRNEYRRLAFTMAKDHCVSVLNYCITSNHTHLLLQAEAKELVGAFMHDLAGTFALQYNRRKERSGAYWEGR